MKKLTVCLLIVFLIVAKVQAQNLGLGLFNLVTDLLNNKSIPFQIVYPPATKEEAKKAKQELFAEIKMFNRAIYEHKDSLALYYRRGVCRKELAAYVDAMDDFRKCIQKKYYSDSSYFQLGLVHLYQGNVPSAIDCFDKVLQSDPKNQEAYFHRGLSYLSWGTNKYKNFKKQSLLAIPEFDKAIELNHNYWQAVFMRGYAKQKTGDFAGETQDYTRVMELKPDLPLLLVFRGLAYHKWGKDELACQDFKNAKIQQVPDSEKFIKKYCSH